MQVERALAHPPASDRLGYVPGAGGDEAFTPEGAVRPLYRELIDALGEADLPALAERSRAAAARDGMTFRTPVGENAFVVDPVPRLFEREEWRRLERGIAQRVRALNAFLADAYGERRIVDAGRIPARVIDAAALFEPDACDVAVPGGIYIGVAGLDVVRLPSGELQVLEDNLRTPSGASYAENACRIAEEVLPFEAPARVTEPATPELLKAILHASAPDGVHEPSIVLLSDGPVNSAWWEHRRLADALGVPIVTPGDLELRGDRLFARPGDDRRPRQVDVVYRRTDEDRLRDEHGRPTWIAELLLEPLRGGHLACVNAFGTGIADDKLVHAYVEDMIRFYLGEEPALRSVPTYDPGEPSARATILERMNDLVIKPRDGSGGDGIVVCAHASADDRRAAADLIRTDPERHVAQETVMFSTHPTVFDGALVPRHVDLRPFAYATPDAVRAVPGGLTRVALDEGALVVNSSQNGGGKATWVLT